MRYVIWCGRPGVHQLVCTVEVARGGAPAARLGVDRGLFRMRTLSWVVDGLGWNGGER